MKKILALILALGMLAATAVVGFAEETIVIEDNDGAFTAGSAAVGSSQEFTVKYGEYGDEEYATYLTMQITGDAQVTLQRFGETPEAPLGTWLEMAKDGAYYFDSDERLKITFHTAGTVEYYIQRAYVALSVSGSEPESREL